MVYLAKSNGESLVQHTNNLLKRCKELQRLYSNILTDREWKLLYYACGYHDLGKINDKFQTKISHNRSIIAGEIPHGLLSITMIPFDKLQKQFTNNELKVLAYAVANHHNRDLSNLTLTQYKQEIENLKINYQQLDLSNLIIDLPTQVPAKVSNQYYKFKTELTPDNTEQPTEFGSLLGSEYEQNDDTNLTYELFVKIKGLLNRLDYAASGHYSIESDPRIVLDNNILHFLGKNAQYNELQNWTNQHKNNNIVVIAQTGLGKTESALRWLSNDKSFFVLPLKAALNSMYTRFKNEICNKNIEKSNQYLALLHSDMLGFISNDTSSEDFTRVVNEDRQWSKQLSLATLDQTFNFVYHYQGYEPKLATLSYSKVVIDEIQMYSPDLLAYLLYGLKEIQKYGGKFDIMTATLAPFILDLLRQYNIDFVQPEHPFLDDKINHRHKVKTVHKQLTSDDILKLDQNQKTLVVVNTVKQAVNLYNNLKASNKNVHLIHSRFIRKDRNKKEQEIYDFSHSDKTGIWIGTQVVEASLDIDFDLLITELSELNGLFQRMGRCYRKRNYDGQLPNVYIFDGGGKNPSGISRNKNRTVVNYQMYSLSKKAVVNLNGYLSEQDKLNLINQNYTSKNLTQTNDDGFVNQIKNDYQYLISVQSEQLNKYAVKRQFRNIQSETVIPEQVYLNNQEKIDNITNQLINKTYKNRTDAIKLREQLNSYCVSVYNYVVRPQYLVDNTNLNKLHYLILSKVYNYSSDTGLSTKENESSDDDNFF